MSCQDVPPVSRTTPSPRNKTVTVKLGKTPTSRAKTRKRTRRHEISSSSDEFESQIDQQTEASLQQVAARNNLSKSEVKHILKKVVGNDHVVALVQIKAEEYEKNQNCISAQTTETNQSIKLTRSKAKATNTDPLPKKLLPLKTSDPPPEIAALINEELCSDDEDEEYRPGDDDAHSEDDINTTASDLDSQPRTPLNASVLTEDEGTPKFTKDGLFKIPRDRNDSFSSQTEHDYLIAQRTRSKVSLEGTLIETLESSFEPEKDADCEEMFIDYNYLEFLNDLFNPVENVDKVEAANVEEDDDDDEDFTMAVDQMPSNRDEMSNPTISQKECEELFQELFGEMPDLNTYEDKATAEQPPQPTQLYTAPDTNYAFQPMQMSTPLSEDRHQTISNAEASPIISNIITNVHNSIAIGGGTTCATQPIVPITFNTVPATSCLSLNQPLSTDQLSAMPFRIPLAHLNPYSSAVIKDGLVHLPQFQHFVIAVPTAEILQSQLTQTDQSTMQNVTNSSAAQSPALSPSPPASKFEYLKYEKPTCYVFDNNISGFTPWQRNILDQQLRMHVQLAAQHYLMTFGHHQPHLGKLASVYKGFLIELNDVTLGTAVKIANLPHAMQLVTEWETDLSVSCRQNTAYLEHLSQETTSARQKKTFPELFMQKCINSKAFIYPKLLPYVPFCSNPKPVGVQQFVPEEEFLLAFGLEKYTAQLQKELDRKNEGKWRKYVLKLRQVCDEMQRTMFSHRTTNAKRNQIYNRVTRLKSKRCAYNPVQYYFQHKMAPMFRHHLYPLDVDNLLEPINAPITDMPLDWAEYIKQHKQLIAATKNTQNETKPKPLIQPVAPRIRSSVCRKLCLDNKGVIESLAPQSVLQTADEPSNRVRIEYLYGDNLEFAYNAFEIHIGNVVANDSNLKSDSATSLDHERDNVSLENNIGSIFCSATDSSVVLPSTERLTSPKSQNPLQSQDIVSPVSPPYSKHTNVRQIRYARALAKRNRNKFNATHKRQQKQRYTKELLVCKLQKIHREFRRDQRSFQHNRLLLSVLNCVKTLEIYADSLINLKMSGGGTVKRLKTSIGTASTTAVTTVVAAVGDDVSRKICKPNDDMAESTTLEKDSAASSAGTNHNRRSQKVHRTPDNVRMMLVPESPEDINEKDFVFAQNFMDKVEETYMSEKNSSKSSMFERILRDFDPTTEKAADLYYKMESLFLPDHPELAELFLTFLLPGEAAQVGKFMEHFMLTNMSNFINKLSIFFHKQPAQTRKILTCLKELSNEPDLKMDQLRSKVLPLLKSNPLMCEWFLQCFPSDDCVDVDNDYESLNFHKASETMDDTDVYEHIPQTEILADPIDNPCHIRYQNGRIHYGSRILLPAKLSFMVTQATSADDDESTGLHPTATHDIEMVRPEATRQHRCVHAIKRFGDFKLREQQRENEHNTSGGAGSSGGIVNGGGGHCSTDDSDRTDDEMLKVNCSNVSDASIKSEDTNTSGESLEVLSNVCDDMTLKAHAFRLNPTAHSTEVIKPSDLLELLRPGAAAEKRLIDTEKDALRISPNKKPFSAKTTVRRTLSPNHKKVPATSNKSPTNKRTTTVQPILTTSSTSQAVQTAKKLKKLISATGGGNRKKCVVANDTKLLQKRPKKPLVSDQIAERKLSAGDDEPAQATTSNSEVTNVSNSSGNDKTLTIFNDDSVESPESEDDDEDAEDETDDENDKEESRTKEEQELDSMTLWSRDEDKFLLEQIKMGFTSEDELVRTLQTERLPQRSLQEIHNRFTFLMDIIANL